MNKKSELLQFYENYYNSIKPIEVDDKFADKFYQALLAGNNEVYQKYISETKIFDEDWINTLESYIPSLNKITKDPRTSTKIEEEIVIVEKAKKINADSVRHLSSHTHLIKEITPTGDVKPKKILTSFTELDYGTYENRFLMTLIDRLFIFVKNRYELIRENIDSYERRRFYMKSNFPINETDVDVEVNFTLRDEIANKQIKELNQSLLKRVEYLNKVITSLKYSQFMELMKGQNRIYPPIMKTNVILKNVDFRNAYLLWLFLDRYNTLAFTTEIEEKDLTITEDYQNALNRQMLTLYSSVVANQEMNKKEYEELESKIYEKQSIRTLTTHPDDMHLTPEDQIMEDMTLNEYYLNANKQIFKQSLEYHQEHAATYETSLKRALRETLNISNALYQSFFELDDEDDLFSRLIHDIDVNEELKEARRKLFISRMIREVKEVDFNNALRQEKQFLEDIAKFDKVLLDEYKHKLEISQQDILRQEKLEKDREKALLEKEFVDKQLKENKYLSAEVDKQRVEINKRINDLQKELNDKYNEEIKEYKKELREQVKQELQEFKDKHEPKRRVTNEILKQEKEILEEDFIIDKQILTDQQEDLLNKEKSLLKEESDIRVEEDKEKYMQMLEENEKNVQALEEHKKKFEEELQNYEQELQERQNASIEDYKVQLRRQETEVIAVNRQKYKIDNRITDYRLEQELAKLEQRLEREKQKMMLERHVQLRKEQAELDKKSKAKTDKQIEKLKDRKEDNIKNTKLLEEARLQTEIEIEELKR